MLFVTLRKSIAPKGRSYKSGPRLAAGVSIRDQRHAHRFAVTRR